MTDSNNQFFLKVTQFFSESNLDEYDLLKSFIGLVRPSDVLVTYNGNRFDIPFTNARLNKYSLDAIDASKTFDLYFIAKYISKLISLPNLKQKTIENFLNIRRDDVFSGLELITVYKNYVKRNDDESLKLLLLHNSEDVQGMLHLFKLFSYKERYDSYFDDLSIYIDECKENEYIAFDGSKSKEILVEFHTSNSFPACISINEKDFFFRLNKSEGRLSIKPHNGILKHFIKDYKNYYYLPDEDTVIHKDLAVFVDPNHRTKVNASNCCIKKDSSFVMTYSDKLKYQNKKLPIFKESLKSKDLYIEYDEKYMNNKEFLADYVLATLLVLCKEK